MPCYDGGVPYQLSREEVLDRKVSAILCGLVRVIGADVVLSTVDWKEAGVSQSEFREWWSIHQRRDEQRKQREAAYKRQRQLREQVEAKLTPEELEILRRN